MKSHGPWKIMGTNDIYCDPYINVWRDDVIRPDGLNGQHVVVTMKPGVCVLALDDERNVHLTDEFHYGIGRNSLEAVSGGIEPGEDPNETASRELAEELGLAAASCEYLSTVDPFTTIVVSPTRLYLATGLSEVESQPEGTELIEHRIVPLESAFEMVLRGDISHAPTCVVIMMTMHRLGHINEN